MKCQLCDNEATVHELVRINGAKAERHLCESCAQQQGITPQMPIAELVSKFMEATASGTGAAAGASGSARRVTACPACGQTFAEFRNSGQLGCPECYRAFEAQLGPLLERWHEGGAAHAGKSPRRQGGAAATPAPQPQITALQERAEKLRALQRQLDEAVTGEKYELAAKLRDELKRLGNGGDDPGGKGHMS